MSEDKLDWEYDNESGDQHTWRNGYRISAVRDDYPENPFKMWDGNWPIAIYDGSDITVYDKVGDGLSDPFAYFTDELIVHMQVHIAKALGTSIPSIAIDWLDAYDHDEPPPNYVHDADGLRDAFQRVLSDEYDSKKLDIWRELYELAGIPCYSTTSRGYSQGDWAELLVVATPAARKAFGYDDPPPVSHYTQHVHDWWEQRLEPTADLWTAWAWGDVYGFKVEFAVYDEDGEIEDWEEVEDGSCWGYYGSDHSKSGLEEAALSCVPDEPAPGVPVRSPDAIEECVA